MGTARLHLWNGGTDPSLMGLWDRSLLERHGANGSDGARSSSTLSTAPFAERAASPRSDPDTTAWWLAGGVMLAASAAVAVCIAIRRRRLN